MICTLFIALALHSALYASKTSVHEQINAIREQYSLPPLKKEFAASLSAENHARDLSLRGVLSHRSTNGDRVLDRYRAIGGTALIAGENLGAGDTISAIIAGWMQSPTHRANLLNPQWTCIGMGLMPLDSGRIVLVCVFTISLWSDITAVKKQTGNIRIEGHYQGHIFRGSPILRINGRTYTPELSMQHSNAPIVFDIAFLENSHPHHSIILEMGYRSTKESKNFFTDMLRLPIP